MDSSGKNIVNKPNLLVKLGRSPEKPVHISWKINGSLFGFTLGETYLPVTLIYAEKGDCFVSLRDREVLIERGSYFICGENERFYVSGDRVDEAGAVLLLFRGGFTSGVVSDSVAGRVLKAEGDFFRVLDTMSNNTNRLSTDRQWGDEKFYEVMMHLTKADEETEKEIECLTFQKRTSRIEIYKRLNKARDFIRTYYNEKLSLDKISEEAGLSKYYLIKLFKELYETTPYEYLIRQRIEKASRMLNSKEKTISGICYDTGFESPSTFSLVFKKHTGLSPREYRNLQRN